MLLNQTFQYNNQQPLQQLGLGPQIDNYLIATNTNPGSQSFLTNFNFASAQGVNLNAFNRNSYSTRTGLNRRQNQNQDQSY
jgi:hypothetical protein